MKRILLTAICLVIGLSTIDAQSISGLIFSGDVENMAMGDVVFTAPKLVNRKVSVNAVYSRWSPNFTGQNEFGAAAFICIGEGTGIHLLGKYNMYPQYSIVDATGNTTGTFKPTELIAGGGLNFRWGSNLYTDLTFKYVSQNLTGSAAKAFCGDVNISYSNNGFTVGVKGSNIGSKLEFTNGGEYSLPMNVKAGLSYSFSAALKHRFLFAANAGYYIPEAFKAFTASAGAEYSFNNIVFLRGGYNYSANTASVPSFATAGLGLRFKGVGLKATYIIAKKGSPLENSFLCGLSFDL